MLSIQIWTSQLSSSIFILALLESKFSSSDSSAERLVVVVVAKLLASSDLWVTLASAYYIYGLFSSAYIQNCDMIEQSVHIWKMLQKISCIGLA